LLAELIKLGSGFDCASIQEIDAVQRLSAEHGSAPSIIYAHPVKPVADIESALERGVKRTTFDSVCELEKFDASDGAELVLRISSSDPTATCVLANKYGAEEEDWPELIEVAKRRGLNVVGVSFHVGSGANRLDCYREAVVAARRLMDSLRNAGFAPYLLDIGGGFTTAKFEKAANILRKALAECDFDKEHGFEVIAEPGRLFCADAFTLYTPVIGYKRGCVTVDQSCYGTVNCLQNDHATPTPEFDEGVETTKVTLFGSSCDGGDVLYRDFVMPSKDVAVGAYLKWPRTGAYTLAASSDFNGLGYSKVPVNVVV